MSFAAFALLALIATGCVGDIGSRDMSYVASPEQGTRQITGSYRNVNITRGTTQGRVFTLWALLTNEHDKDWAAFSPVNPNDVVRIIAWNDGTLLAIHLINGQEMERKAIGTSRKDGYILSGRKWDAKIIPAPLFVFFVDPSYGLGLDENNDLVGVYHASVLTFFPPWMLADSGAPVRVTFARKLDSQQRNSFGSTMGP